MFKFAGLAAAVMFVVCTSIPAHADCPDGRCPNGTILPDTPAAREHDRAVAAQRERAQCLARCQTFCNQNMQTQCGACKFNCTR
jgi:hypothetical protein